MTGEELTGVAIRLAVVPDVCAALTTAAPTETESATEETAPIISNATAEEESGNLWQKLARQKMYYNDEIFPELLRYKSLREDCCASCGKKYDLYHRTLNAAWDDHDRAKKSLDVLENLKKEDGGETFELWLSQTEETSGLFALSGIGSEYVFRVVAFDGVGNASSGVTASITIESDDAIRWSESVYVVTEDCALRLSAEGSTGDELTYYWDLSGSETVDASNFTEGEATIWTSPKALGFKAGEYTIRLRVRDKS